MAAPSDIRDLALRAALEEADALLGDAKYAESVRKSVQAYALLIEKRPELIVRPPPAGPNSARVPFGQVAAPTAEAPGPIGAGRGWPSLIGVRMTFDANDKPQLSFEKERFSMSEAATYFEFALEQIARAQVIQ